MSASVVFTFKGQDFSLSLDESDELLDKIRIARDSIKVKCPTCRCRIYPGNACCCCAGSDIYNSIDEGEK